MSYDVLVVGGGLIGMLTARYLQIEGFSVALIERHKLGGESSWAAGGILSRLYPWQQNKEMQRLVAQGQASFPALVAELEDETYIDPQLLHSGMIIVDIDEQQAALMWSKKFDTKIELISRSEIQQLEPNLEKTIDTALYIPSTMQVRPPLLINAVHQSLQNHGVHIFEGVDVEGLVLQNSEVVGVETNQEFMYADQVVICSGAWTQQLLNNAGVQAADIQPVRGQMLLFKTQQNLFSRITVKDGFYLIPRRDQYVLCGSTVEYVGFDRATTQNAKRMLSSKAQQLYPKLRDKEIVKHWSALRPGTNRELPYMCAHPEIDGLFINAGHFRYGIVMSVPAAKMTSDLIANKATTSQISAYAW
jgi:glycine oxidase